MCSPVLDLPRYKEPPQYIPCIPVKGPPCLPCGMDPVTLRRPLIVHDSTFDYRPTSWPGMVLNNQDKKVRYQLINYDRPGRVWRLPRRLLPALRTPLLWIGWLPRDSLQSSSTYSVNRRGYRASADQVILI
ncbi:hypothetical protein RR46_11807 [Papilio xuthus]|uniref:Uncharacterized protein n=1 Tax=Papilio xuthus TaxID=66420 RepID=A0A194PP94_PAPXU|nr:hypothetical protein RR46_11807 [Papilio xuthus]